MNACFEWILRHRFLVILTTLVAIFAAAYGARLLIFKSDYRVFFGPENPQLQAFERMQKTFAKSDNVIFLLAPENGDVFTEQSLQLVKDITEAAWQLPHSSRVDSITNFQHIYAEGDDLIVEDLVLDAEGLTPQMLEQIRQISLDDPRLVNRLVSPSGHVTAINVNINLPGKNLVQEVPEVADAARALKADMLAQYDDVDIYLNGMVMMNAAFSEASLEDNATLVPLMFVVVVVFIGVLIRTLTGTLATLVIIISSIGGAMGLAGWFGMYLTGPSASAPTIILTLAVADCVHILATLYHEMRLGADKRSAILTSLKINMQPIALTSVTTAIGFLSMNFSDSPPFRDLGNIVAIGVLLAWVLSMTLFPAILSLLPLSARGGQTEAAVQSVWDRAALWVIGHRKWLFWFCSALVVVCVSQIPRNELNDNFVEYFDTSVPFRVAADFSDANLTGMSVMEFELESGEQGGISNPEYLRNASAFVGWLRTQPETIHVDSLTDTIRQLNQSMHGGDEAFYRLPQSRELAAQYLLLYEMSLPYGLDLNNQINIDKSAIRVVANFHNLTSNELLELEQRAENWLAANVPQLQVTITSPSLIFAHIGQRNIESMLTGTLLALVLISALLGVALRSLKFGVLSLIPNLVPAGMAFGIWGMLVGEVGLALSVVTGMTLGIVVDDTVHFLSKYLYARRQRQADTEAAIRYAFNNVGQALWVTTLVLAAGFMVLAQSSFKVNADMGLLAAVTIVIALIMDFLLLPSLLLLLERKKSGSNPATPTATESAAPSATQVQKTEV